MKWAEVRGEEKEPPSRRARATPQPIRVLVLEDEAIVARHIVVALNKRGFEVVGRAASGEAAIKMAADLEPDLVLADIHLHGPMSGIEAVSAIQKSRDVAVVYLTAYSDPQTLEQAVATNPSGYMVKPFTEASLSCTVEVALRKHLSERDAHLRSQRDELTGIHNRRAFMTLSTHLKRCAQRDGKSFALVFFDLDGFKKINDELGHAEGDACLRTFSKALESTFRRSDVVARLGGDEFAAFVMDSTEDGVDRALHRLEETLDAHAESSPRGRRIEASAGVIRCSPSDLSSIEELLARADRAMYENKRARKSLRTL